MPVIFRAMESLLNRGGVKSKAVRRIGKQSRKPDEQGLNRHREIFCLFLTDAMEIRAVGFWHDPGLERKTGRKG